MITFGICEGNPGVFTFVMNAYDNDCFRAEACFQRMQDNGITGTKLYMLWNDCCDRDTDKAMDVMERMDIAEIEKHINYDGGRGIPFEEGKP